MYSYPSTDLEEVEITEGTTVYTYNAINQLITEVSEGVTKTYLYDANGNLIKQTGDFHLIDVAVGPELIEGDRSRYNLLKWERYVAAYLFFVIQISKTG